MDEMSNYHVDESQSEAEVDVTGLSGSVQAIPKTSGELLFPDMADQDKHATPDIADQDEHVTTVDQLTSCNVVSENDGPVRDDEPIIEIPVVSESSRETFKLRVTLADFCKLPVKQVVKCDGAEHYLIHALKPLSNRRD